MKEIGSEKTRIFLASAVPSETYNLLHELQSTLHYEGWKWMRTHNLHLTLFFIGEIFKNDLSQLDKVIRLILPSFFPIELITQGLAWMPEKNPRMLWIKFFKNNLIHT